MVEITLLEIELEDAEFNAPFARGGEATEGGPMGGGPAGGGSMGGLGRVVGEMVRSGGRESREVETDVQAGETAGEDVEGEAPGRGVAMVGAFLALLVVGWMARRRARRRGKTVEEMVEAS